jgi:hypothetical protein
MGNTLEQCVITTKPSNDLQCSRECKIQTVTPTCEPHRTSRQRFHGHPNRIPSTLRPWPLPTRPHPPRQLSGDLNNFISKMATNLSLRQPHRQREHQRCPGPPGPPVAPLGRLDCRTRLLSNRRPPAPAFCFARALRVGARSVTRGIMNVKHLATFCLHRHAVQCSFGRHPVMTHSSVFPIAHD